MEKFFKFLNIFFFRGSYFWLIINYKVTPLYICLSDTSQTYGDSDIEKQDGEEKEVERECLIRGRKKCPILRVSDQEP